MWTIFNGQSPKSFVWAIPLRLILLGERFLPIFSKFGNNWRYVSIYGGVLSLFVKFSRSKNFKFVKFHILEEKIRKMWKIEKLGEKISGKSGRLKNWAKKIRKLWGKSSLIRMTLNTRSPEPTVKAIPIHTQPPKSIAGTTDH